MIWGLAVQESLIRWQLPETTNVSSLGEEGKDEGSQTGQQVTDLKTAQGHSL